MLAISPGTAIKATCGSRLQVCTSSGASAAVPYEAEDVDAALALIVANRQKVAEATGSSELAYTPSPTMRPDRIGESGEGEGGWGGLNGEAGAAEAPAVKRKTNVKVKIRRVDDSFDEEDAGDSEPDVWAALEIACNELGYDADFIVEFLEQGTYPQALLDHISTATSCQDLARIRDILNAQKGAFLGRMRQLIQVRLKQKSEEEAMYQAKLKKIGRCPMDFEWLREEGGWRCAGGSHWVSDSDMEQFML